MFLDEEVLIGTLCDHAAQNIQEALLGRVCPTVQSLLRVVAALAPVRAACGLPPHEDEAVVTLAKLECREDLTSLFKSLKS